MKRCKRELNLPGLETENDFIALVSILKVLNVSSLEDLHTNSCPRTSPRDISTPLEEPKDHQQYQNHAEHQQLPWQRHVQQEQEQEQPLGMGQIQPYECITPPSYTPYIRTDSLNTSERAREWVEKSKRLRSPVRSPFFQRTNDIFDVPEELILSA